MTTSISSPEKLSSSVSDTRMRRVLPQPTTAALALRVFSPSDHSKMPHTCLPVRRARRLTRFCKSGLSTGLNLKNNGSSSTGARFAITTTKDRKSTRLNSSHGYISYAVFCLKKKNKKDEQRHHSKIVKAD